MSEKVIIINRSSLRLTTFLLFLFISVMVCALIILDTKRARVYRTNLKESILNKLVNVNPPDIDKKVDVIYLLGGNQNSMEFKVKTASEFFHKSIQ